MVMCFAPDCKHYSERGMCKSFFKFPKDEKLKKKWIDLLRRKDRLPTANTMVCSCHFVDQKKENLPTIFTHNKDKRMVFTSPEQKKRRLLKSIEEPETSREDNEDSDETEDNAGPEKVNIVSPKGVMEAELYLLHKEKEDMEKKISQLHRQPFTIECIEKDDKLITYYTGLPGEKIFNILFKLFSTLNVNYVYGWNVEGLSRKNQLLMTLMKLRLNLGHQDLAVRFSCSQATVSNVILTWIHVLHHVLVETFPIKMPSQHKNKACLPNAFSTFDNCRVVIDCTEVYGDVPHKLDKQRLTYSHYKHRNTLKGLVGVAPNGVVTFVSKLYPGSTSDKEIVKHCGILDQLTEGDLILADKGFLIGDLLPSGVSLNIPPFLSTPQFTPDQVLQTKLIARARIHVERSINRIKGYHILDYIPTTLFQFSSKIFQLCGALTNWQYPLLQEVEIFYKPKD